MAIGTNNDEKVRIDSSGNLGIGTSSPDSLLHIFGNTASSNIPRIKIEANGWSNDCRIERSSGSDGFYITNNYDTSTSTADVTSVGTSGVQIARGDLRFHTGSSGAFTERMRIDSSGVVQVRNQTPTIQLYNTDTSVELNQTLGDIDWYQSDPSDQGVGTVAKIRAVNIGSIAGYGELTFHTGSATSIDERVRIDYQGNVGIGTTSPNNIGHIKTSVNGEGLTLQINSTTQGDYSQLSFVPSTADNTVSPIYIRGVRGSSLATSYLTLNTNSTERMRIDSSGLVSIKNNSTTTSSPTLRLDANPKTSWDSGDIIGELDFYTSDTSANAPYSTAFIQSINETDESTLPSGSLVFGTATHNAVGGATERMRIDSSGNVGIGTTSVDSTGYVNLETAKNIRIDVGDANADPVLYFSHDNFSSATSNYITLNRADESMRFNVNDNERMRINSSGRVGINQTPSSHTLDVKSIATSSYVIVARSSATSNQLGGIYEDSSNNAEFYLKDSTSSTNVVLNSSGNSYLNGGNLGIGTSSPNYPLTVHKTGDGIKFEVSDTVDANYRIQVSGNDIKLGSSTGSDQIFITSNTERMRITSSGNVGINETNPSTAKLVIETGPTSGIDLYRSAVNANFEAFRFRDSSNANTEASIGWSADQLRLNSTNNTVFTTGGTERMRITSGGSVLIDTTDETPNSVTTSAHLVSVNDGVKWAAHFAATSIASRDAVAFSNPNGKIGAINTTGTTTSYETSSDYRLKENVVPMEGALDRVDALKPSRFNFIADADKTVDGFLAHEVADIVPEAISGEKDAVDEEGNAIYQGIDQSKLVPLLVGAIKELRAEIETLKSQINP